MKQDIHKKIVGSKKVKSPPSSAYRYSRKAKADVQAHCTSLEHITILEGPERYWVYDDDAETLSDLFGFELYKTKKGYTLVYEKSLHEVFIEELKTQGINSVIVHPDTISEVLPTAIPIPKGVPLEEGVSFMLKDREGTVSRYIIRSVVESERFAVTSIIDGSTVIMRRPILQDSSDPDVSVISRRAPLAGLLIGKHVGDTITFNGYPLEIVSIGN